MQTQNDFEIPERAELVTMLVRQRNYLQRWKVESTDVRLCVDPGHWWLAFGPVDFDTSHAQHCAASEISAEMSLQDISDIAQCLIDDISIEIEIEADE